MFARKVEKVQPLIDVGREDRIARYPIGEFRMVERRSDGLDTGRPDAVSPALSFPRRR